MVRRLQKLSKNSNILLFGARATGKSTLIREVFKSDSCLWIDLLKDQDEEFYGRNPDELSNVLEQGNYKTVVVDEIQKSPKLLDIIHLEIEKHPEIQFVATGSSARKLKRGAANLLAGRAFTYQLHPLTYRELEEQFNLKEVLSYGALPSLLAYEEEEDKREYLRSYVKTYLREEIQIEQLVRSLNPFRDFLEIAAQSNGKIINYSKVARDIGTDDKTVRNYFSILEDTLVGYHLPPFHRSIRKRQREAPKFYLFDIGVKRALEGTLRVELVEKSFAFGNAFEHFVITECHRLNEYLKLDFKLSYLRTKDDAEIDLIIERPNQPDLLVEIKSADKISKQDISSLERLYKDWDREAEAQVWSLEKVGKKIDSVSCKYWMDALNEVF